VRSDHLPNAATLAVVAERFRDVRLRRPRPIGLTVLDQPADDPLHGQRCRPEARRRLGRDGRAGSDEVDPGEDVLVRRSITGERERSPAAAGLREYRPRLVQRQVGSVELQPPDFWQPITSSCARRIPIALAICATVRL
jgi:hypothetical protein